MIADVTLAELADDPHPHLARLRAAAPVAWSPALGGWLVTSRAVALDVMRDAATFTVDDPRFSTARVVGPSMLSTDGPAHAGHREPHVAPFRKRAVTARFGPFVDAAARRLVDDLGRRADLRTDLAAPLAAATVAESLGLDGRDDALVARLVGWYREIVASVSGIAAGDEPSAAGTAAMGELRAVLAARGGDADVGDAAVILFGGLETTEGMILNLCHHVLGDVEVRAAVAADPALVDPAVEESLRLEPAATVVDRYATRPVMLAGTVIPAGDLVVVSLAAANRDPAEFPSPDRFDLHRPNLRRQLAFAAGPHVCIGMDLARLEAATALRALLARWPDIRRDLAAPAPRGLVFRKPDSLVVTTR